MRHSSTTEAGYSPWSDPKFIATKMAPVNQVHEYVDIYARGIGAKNHNSAKVKIDD